MFFKEIIFKEYFIYEIEDNNGNSNTTSSILNDIPNIENLSYLELGLGMGWNFKRIICRDKTGVDNNEKRQDDELKTFLGTTDQFFEQCNKIFDIIFIDACHITEYVERDFNNSIKHSNKFIFLHDTIPVYESYSKPEFCDCGGFRILAYILKETNMKPLIWDEKFNMGLSLFYIPFEKVELTDFYKNLTYYEFMRIIKDYKLSTKEEIQQYIIERI